MSVHETVSTALLLPKLQTRVLGNSITYTWLFRDQFVAINGVACFLCILIGPVDEALKED